MDTGQRYLVSRLNAPRHPDWAEALQAVSMSFVSPPLAAVTRHFLVTLSLVSLLPLKSNIFIILINFRLRMILTRRTQDLA